MSEKVEKQEKLLVCDALDERDFLRKKIVSDIQGAKFCGSKRKKDAKIGGVSTPEEFSAEAKSQFQSIRDNIARYERLNVALTESNATTIIQTRSGKEMTRAAAIAMRKSLNALRGDETLTGLLLSQLERQYESAVGSVTSLNRKADSELETYKNNQTSKDGQKSLSEDMLQTLEKLVEDLYGELIDPLELGTKLSSLKEEHEALKKELDSAIKVSNATTYVEF